MCTSLNIHAMLLLLLTVLVGAVLANVHSVHGDNSRPGALVLSDHCLGRSWWLGKHFLALLGTLFSNVTRCG